MGLLRLSDPRLQILFNLTQDLVRLLEAVSDTVFWRERQNVLELLMRSRFAFWQRLCPTQRDFGQWSRYQTES